jgi:hypothetical protein
VPVTVWAATAVVIDNAAAMAKVRAATGLVEMNM